MTMKSLTELHARLIRNGLHTDPASISQVLISYSSNLNKGCLVFNQIQRPTTFVWNSMIHAYSQSDQPIEAIHFYNEMQAQGVTPNKNTLIFFTRACTRLQNIGLGQKAHLNSLKLGFGQCLVLNNCLIHMYATCGDVRCASKVFDRMSVKDLVSWNSLMGGCIRNSHFHKVLSLFEAMQEEKVKVDAITMVKVVLACSHLDVEQYIDSVMKYMKINNVEIDVYLGNTLIDLYGRRGSVESARNIFDGMPKRNIYSWNTMITTYTKLGDLDTARELFDIMPEKNVISWTSLITGYSQSNKYSDAVKLFREMMVEEVKPDKRTIASVLSACAHLRFLDVGKAIHEYTRAENIELDIHVENSLMDMYLKCGCTLKALEVFEGMTVKDTVSWNCIISGLADSGDAEEALKIFSNMLKEGAQPCDVTYIGVLVACTHAGLVDEGLRHFENMITVHQVKPTMKLYGCVVNLLSRSGQLEKAYEFIKEMPVTPDAAVWRILLSGCSLHKNLFIAEIAMEKLHKLDPSNSVNYTNSLIDMYFKCGCSGKALEVFEWMKIKDTVSWNCVINGLADNGDAKEALRFFSDMLKEGAQPSDVTFIGVLVACTHAGLAEEGLQYYNNMITVYQVEPTMKLYGCVVNLLSRSGFLEKAYEFIKRMPVTPDAAVWRILLGGCTLHKNISIAEIAVEKLYDLDPKNSGNYVCLSNSCSGTDENDDATSLRKSTESAGQEVPSCSSNDVDGLFPVSPTADELSPVKSNEVCVGAC